MCRSGPVYIRVPDISGSRGTPGTRLYPGPVCSAPRFGPGLLLVTSRVHGRILQFDVYLSECDPNHNPGPGCMFSFGFLAEAIRAGRATCITGVTGYILQQHIGKSGGPNTCMYIVNIHNTPLNIPRLPAERRLGKLTNSSPEQTTIQCRVGGDRA